MQLPNRLTRRRFLKGISLLGAFLVASQPVAGLRSSGSTGAATGRSVLNGFSQYTDIVFANFFKQMNSLSFGKASPADLHSNLYPKDTASLTDSIAGILSLPPSQFGINIPYVLKWTGRGAMNFALNMNVTSVQGRGVTGVTRGAQPNGIDPKGTNVRIVFWITNSSSPNGVQINLAGGAVFSGFSNLVICRLSDEAAVDAESYAFLPEHISLVRFLNPKVLRLMGWACNGGKDSLLSKYAYRTPVDSLSYFCGTYPNELWTDLTGGTGDAYTCSPSTDMPGTTWIDGMMLQVRFDRANTTNKPTIRPTGFTAKTMLNSFAGPLQVGTGNELSINTNERATLVYDAILDAVLVQSGGITAGPPVEVRVAFCNAVNKDYWHNFPFVYTDASITSETSYIAANLNSSLNAKFELSNEMWNSGLSNAYQIAASRGTALGITTSGARNQYAGIALRVRQVMALVGSAWGARGGLERVFAWLFIDVNTGMQRRLLEGIDLTGVGNATYARKIGVNYTAVGQRPIDFVEDLAYAPYYDGAQARQFEANYTATNCTDLLTAADNYNSGGSGITTALAWLDNDLRAGNKPTQSVISSVSGGTTFNSTANGRANGDEILFLTTGTIYTGITLKKIYYIVNVAANTFQVALTPGGAALSGISGGTGTQSIAQSASFSLLGLDTGAGYANVLGFGGVYPAWQSIAKPSVYNKNVVGYEGGLGIIAPSANRAKTIGLAGVKTITSITSGSPLTINLTAHGLSIGDPIFIGVANLATDSLPTNLADAVVYYVVSAGFTANAFQISLTPGGASINGGVGGPGVFVFSKYSARIALLFTAYRNSSASATLVYDQFRQFTGQDATSANVGLLGQSKFPAWLSLAAEDEWSLMQGDTFSTPFHTYSGVQAFNNS